MQKARDLISELVGRLDGMGMHTVHLIVNSHGTNGILSTMLGFETGVLLKDEFEAIFFRA